MSNDSDSAAKNSQPSRLDLFNLRQFILADLTRALASAAARLLGSRGVEDGTGAFAPRRITQGR